MTLQEEARMLVDRFNHFDESYYHESFKDTDLGKRCALIALDFAIGQVYSVDHKKSAKYDTGTDSWVYVDCIELTHLKNLKETIKAL